MALADQIRKDIPFPPIPDEQKPVDQPATKATEDNNAGELQAAPDAQETQQEEQVVEQQDTTQDLKERPNDRNIRALREKAEASDRRAEESERRNEEMAKTLAALKDQLLPKKNEDAPANLNVEDDDYLEGKHYKALRREIEQNNKLLKQQQLAAKDSAAQQRLNQEHPDFNKVFNEDNIKTLKTLYPQLADTILNSQSDNYTKGSSVYTMIKNLGIYKDDTFKGDKESTQMNASKPKPSVAVAPQQGDTPLDNANAFANGLTKDLKKQIWQQMKETLRNN